MMVWQLIINCDIVNFLLFKLQNFSFIVIITTFFSPLQKMCMKKNNLQKRIFKNEIDVSIFSNIFYTKILENIIDLKNGAKRQS